MRLQTCIAVFAVLALAGCASSDKAASARRQNVMPAPKGAWLAQDEAAGADDEFDLLEEELDEQKVKIPDPLKGYNRAMHNFNDRLYFSVLKPFAKACKKAVPKPARISIRNFFNNLGTPARYVSCLLQNKRRAAGKELHRFAYNTTVGVLGFGDPARDKLGLEPADEDLGQTLGKWGVGNGVYLVLPLLGPSTVRDTVGLVGGQFLNPVRYVDPTEVSIAISAGKIANENTFTIGKYESFKSAAVDPYVAMRNAYIQYRDKQVQE